MRKGLCMVYAREGRSGWKPLRLPRQGGLFRDHRVLKRQVRNNLLSTAHEIGSPSSVKPGRPSESYPMHRRTLLTGVAVLGASAATACSSRPLQSGQQTPTAAVEQNTTKRRG